MKKKKLWKIILFIIFVIIFSNLVYYLATNWQNFFPAKNSAESETGNWKNYSNSKLGLEVEYPPSWIVQDEGNMVEINPPSPVGITYFSVGQRDDFKSLEEIKNTLAPTVSTTSIQISDAAGFEYNDSDFYEVIWLLHSGKIYLIRTYSSPFLGDEGADQILSTLKFSD